MAKREQSYIPEGSLTPEERLLVGGYALPRVRHLSGRKAKRYKPETGEVVGEVDVADVALSLLKRHEIETSVEPEEALRQQKICPGFDRPCPTRARVPASALKPERIRKRGGPWHCFSCVGRRSVAMMTDEQRLMRRRKMAEGRAKMTPEQRRQTGLKAAAKLTAEEHREKLRRAREVQGASRLENLRASVANMTLEQRQERMKHARETQPLEERVRRLRESQTTEQLRENGRKAVAGLTPEQRRERALKGQATRRRLAAERGRNK